MNTPSIKLMLLGIGLIVFSFSIPATVAQLFELYVVTSQLVMLSRTAFEMLVSMIDSLFALAGLILLFVGFFRREAANKA